jgi:UDP-N-acetylmuramate dehydrogenase
LFSDRGFDGVVIRLVGELREYYFKGTRLFAGAGCLVPVLVSRCAQEGLSGIEGLAGVPGTLGGALCGNAGTDGGWICDVVESVSIINKQGRIEDIARANITFGYRSSSLAGQVVVSAVLALKSTDKNDILKAVNKILIHRQQTQPIGTFNAGSVFKNPPSTSAGALIEAAGLKGYRVGGAQVSQKHANFIVNTGAATSADVVTVIKLIREKVRAKCGITLETEIKIIEA